MVFPFVTLFNDPIGDPMLGRKPDWILNRIFYLNFRDSTTTYFFTLSIRLGCFINGVAPLGMGWQMSFISSRKAFSCMSFITEPSANFISLRVTLLSRFVSLILNSPINSPVDLHFNFSFKHSINLYTHPKVLIYSMIVLHLFATDRRKGFGVESPKHYLVLQCALGAGNSLIPAVPLCYWAHATTDGST